MAATESEIGAPVLETARLRLRCMRAEDAPFILRLLNERSFIENIGDRGVRTLDDARSYIAAGPLASYARHGFGLWRVETRDAQVPIGMCGLLKRETLEDVDVGYALLPEFWSRGYARECVGATLEFAARTLGLARVAAIVSPGNAASIRLLEDLGFRFERMVKLEDDAQPIRYYALDLPDGRAGSVS